MWPFRSLAILRRKDDLEGIGRAKGYRLGQMFMLQKPRRLVIANS